MLLDATQTRALLQHALENHYAILAINADSPACITDALEAARQLDAPVIVETSLWQLKGHSFGAGDASLGMARYLAQLEVLCASSAFSSVPVVFHTDHIKGAGSLELLRAAIRGFDLRGVKLRPASLSLDASELSHADNIASICALCETALEVGVDVTLEMEAGVDDGVTPMEDAKVLLEGVESRYPGRVALWAPGRFQRQRRGATPAIRFEPRGAGHRHRVARLEWLERRWLTRGGGGGRGEGQLVV
jgi:fructose-bisphosphate aldolase, class II